MRNRLLENQISVFLSFILCKPDANVIQLFIYSGFCYHTVEITHQGSVISIHEHTKTDVAIGRSLMYIRNNNGPSTEPCGTPVVIYLVVDLYPLSSTYIDWLNNS